MTPRSPLESTDIQPKGSDPSHGLAYFAPVLPWQQALWKQLTDRVCQGLTLPHAMLAAGISGLGKRRFVWRLVAWLLCQNRAENPFGACGHCESCEWLKSGTHPSLQVLPTSSLPALDTEHSATTSASLNQAKSKMKSAKKTNQDQALAPSRAIKIDDIRQLISFVHQGSQGVRICVFDHAERMTVGAANALLKTLEEPQPLVHLILISDSPAQLLPTIKSRVQLLPLHNIPPSQAQTYIRHQLGEEVADETMVAQLLAQANGAPLGAVAMANAKWYEKRQLWLTTWLALRSGKRSALAASDYWQQQLSLGAFIQLTELMLTDISRLSVGLDALQQDCDFDQAIPAEFMPTITDLTLLSKVIIDTKRALHQNVQEKLAYDKLMQSIAQT